jgi:hypothetical protein
MKLDGNTLIVGFILGVIVYSYVLPSLAKETEKMASLEDEGILKVDTNMCSRDCCKHSQWPVPFEGEEGEDDGNVSSNLMCNGGSGGGCVCLKKEDKTYLSGRAKNLQ